MNTDKEYLFKEAPVKEGLLAMILPSLVAGALNMVNVITDTFFLGNFAEPSQAVAAQAATSSSMPVVLLMNAFSFMLAIGTAITVSHFLGQGKNEKIQQYMANTFVFGWILYVAFVIVMVPVSQLMLPILTGTTEGLVYTNANSYLLIMILGFPTLIFTQISSQTIRAEGQAKLIMQMSIIQLLINCVGNYLLIADVTPFSFYGTGYEAAGSAIATILSQAFMTIVLMRVLFNKEKSNFYIDLKKVKFEKEWLKVFKNGAPQFLVNIFFAIGTTVIAVMAVKLAPEPGSPLMTNASGITVKLVMMVFLLTNGAIQGIQGFFAYQYGAKDFKRLIDGMNYVQNLAIKASAVLFAIFMIGGGVIAHIFSPADQEVAAFVAISLRALAITCIFFPMGHVYFGLFASLGRPDLAMKLAFLRDFVLLSGCAILIPTLLYNISGLYIGEIGLMITFPFSLLLGSLVIILVGRKNINNIKAEYKSELV